MFVCHRCDNPPCCNPRHLFLGTPADNCLDRDRKQRQARGGKIGWGRLTEEDVIAIRSKATGQRGELSALGREYGVSHTMIRFVLLRKNWKHIG